MMNSYQQQQHDQQQQHHQQQGEMMSNYSYSGGTTITTDLIQKYLDENKQLILAILDNQNLGKLNECATYQAKLQHNLMYLAAIADAQPQAPSPNFQVRTNPLVQHGQQQYIQHAHQQQQMVHQSMLGQRNTLSYMQPSTQTLLHHTPQQQQQQFLHVNSPSDFMSLANTNLQFNMPTDSGLGGNLNPSGNFHDFSHGGAGGLCTDNNVQANMGLINNRPDHLNTNTTDGVSGSGQAGAQDSESSYLNVPEDAGN